jgi:putative ABC transport system substrate-binding protein
LRRREFITLLGGTAVAWPRRALAESQPRRIAVLMGLPTGDPLGQAEAAALEQGLKDLGWTANRNVQLEYRWPGSDFGRLEAAAKELVAWNPDVIIARATPSVSAVRRETIVIPIVFLQVADPLGVGFVESLGRPGNNITGFTSFEASLGGKWLELLKEMAPRVTHVGVLFNPETAPFAKIFLQTIDTAAPSFRIEPFSAPARDVAGIERAIVAAAREPGGGLVQIPDSFTVAHRDLIIGLAAEHRLPAIYSNNAFARSGGLVSYAVESIDVFRRAANYVDRILQATRASELPVQSPTKFELVINLKTAKALGLTVPDTVLARADEVIE